MTGEDDLTRAGIDRRKALKVGAAAGAAAWATPAILSAEAAAAATQQPPPGCTFTAVLFDPVLIQTLPIGAPGYQPYNAPNALGASGWTVFSGQVENVNTSFYGNPCSGGPVSAAAAVLDLAGTNQAGTTVNGIDNGPITLPCTGRYRLSVTTRGNPSGLNPDQLSYGIVEVLTSPKNVNMQPCQLVTDTNDITGSAGNQWTFYVQYVQRTTPTNAGPLLLSASLIYLGP